MRGYDGILINVYCFNYDLLSYHFAGNYGELAVYVYLVWILYVLAVFGMCFIEDYVYYRYIIID